MNRTASFLLFGAVTAVALAQMDPGYPIRPVPLRSVTLEDRFWKPRLEANANVTIGHLLDQCDATGRVDNFRKAAGSLPGSFDGWWFNDSDVYKSIEAAAWVLMTRHDPALEARIDSIVRVIAAAQEPDGYLYTPRRTMAPEYRFAKYVGTERWTSLASSHEIYDLGHLYEAATAYSQATGRREMLNIALRSAALLQSTFGPGRLRYVPGHQEVELALVKLAQTTGDRAHADLARFFLLERGRSDGHPLYGEYSQDHRPVVEQTEAVGHAVRALYMYSGMTDIAAAYHDTTMTGALERLWRDVAERKTYVTGGIGAAAGHEGFDVAYELPNLVAYCETCASIASVLWNQRMFQLTGHGRYVDVLERTLYNGVLSGVGLDGKKFFYDNPLESDGRHERSSWFAVACCPPNIGRLLPQVPSMTYAVDDAAIYANLFVAGSATVAVGGDSVVIRQSGNYPWDGNIRFSFSSSKPALTFTMRVRIPGWAREEAMPFGLYRFADTMAATIVIRVNGTQVHADVRNGYAEIARTWRRGDVLEVDLPMPVRRVLAHEAVADDRGRVALQRGPLVYCIEGVDVSDGRVSNLMLPDKAGLSTERDDRMLPGMVIVKGTATDARFDAGGQVVISEKPFRAIPYFAWAHRGRSEMAVWLPREASAVSPLPAPTIASQSTVTASGGDPSAVNDFREPKRSSDRSVRYLHWWPKKGSTEWVQYDFAEPTSVSAVAVYWYDDIGIGECRVPESWRLLYRSGGDWRPVEKALGYGIAKDAYNRTSFLPVTTTGLRIELQLADTLSAGIHEWRVE